MKTRGWLIVSHAAALAVGFAAGVYVLPILTAQPSPTRAEVDAAARGADYRGEFRRDLAGSDVLHWGEGAVSVSRTAVSLAGRIAPGPAYMLYLTPEFVETEGQFLRVKSRSARVGDVKTFENFIVPVHESIDISRYNTVVVWCESFSQFITAAKYR
jgi:Electron transfer DM13